MLPVNMCTSYFSSDKDDNMYSFKRYIYNDIVKALAGDNRVIVLLGPRKCGKTVCLQQIHKAYSNSKYVDLKRVDDTNTIRNTVINSIAQSQPIIYLIDEVTYWDHASETICWISDTFAEYPDSKTQIILAGSQSRALEYWCHKAFAASAYYIRADFLNYHEWLEYKNLEVTADSYARFLVEVNNFYGMQSSYSILDYLHGCLDETVVSNAKSISLILDNDCDKLSVQLLLDVLHAILISRHQLVNASTFAKADTLINDIKYFYEDVADSKVIDRICHVLENRYQALSGIDMESLRQAINFLYNCGLITITVITDDLAGYHDALKVIKSEVCFDESIKSKAFFFSHYNVSIKHPMFYLAILRYLLQSDTVSLPPSLLGSLVECHTRGLLP